MPLHQNNDHFTLNTGAKIPAVALGTWRADSNKEAYDSVSDALKAGYRHIDTAAIYGNEAEVGQAIKDSGVPRDELFVTTKLWNTDHKKVAEAFETSLKKLQLDYVDLYLIHWPLSIDPATEKPYTDWNYIDTYKQLQVLLKTGKTKAIGVSNFTAPKIAKLLADKDVNVVPAVNQVELHPLLPQEELIETLHKHNILPQAYSPLGSVDSPLFKNKDLAKIAEKNGANAGQVLISWAVQRKTVVLPKSVKAERIKGNLQTVTLSEADFQELNNLHKEYGIQRLNTPFDVFTD